MSTITTTTLAEFGYARFIRCTALADVAWTGFVANSERHLATPLTNNVGLKTVLSFSRATRAAVIGNYWLDTPWDLWAANRRRVFQQREPFFWVLVIGFVVLLARAVEAQEDWIALVLGTTLVPVVTELTCYYYSVFVLFALLWRKWPSSGAALCALSASTLLMPVIFPNSDDAFTASSALIVLFVATVIGAMLLRINASKTTLSRITTGNAKPVLQKHA